jgi:hypothetical protein
MLQLCPPPFYTWYYGVEIDQFLADPLGHDSAPFPNFTFDEGDRNSCAVSGIRYRHHCASRKSDKIHG